MKRKKARELKVGDWALIAPHWRSPATEAKWIRVDRLIPRPSSGGIQVAIYSEGRHVRTFRGSQLVTTGIPVPAKSTTADEEIDQ